MKQAPTSAPYLDVELLPTCEVCQREVAIMLDGERKKIFPCGCESPLLVCRGCQRGDALAFTKALKRCGGGGDRIPAEFKRFFAEMGV